MVWNQMRPLIYILAAKITDISTVAEENYEEMQPSAMLWLFLSNISE